MLLVNLEGKPTAVSLGSSLKLSKTEVEFSQLIKSNLVNAFFWIILSVLHEVARSRAMESETPLESNGAPKQLPTPTLVDVCLLMAQLVLFMQNYNPISMLLIPFMQLKTLNGLLEIMELLSVNMHQIMPVSSLLQPSKPIFTNVTKLLAFLVLGVIIKMEKLNELLEQSWLWLGLCSSMLPFTGLMLQTHNFGPLQFSMQFGFTIMSLLLEPACHLLMSGPNQDSLYASFTISMSLVAQFMSLRRDLLMASLLVAGTLGHKDAFMLVSLILIPKQFPWSSILPLAQLPLNGT